MKLNIEDLTRMMNQTAAKANELNHLQDGLRNIELGELQQLREDPVKYIKEMKEEIIELQNIQKDKSIPEKYPIIFMIVSNIISAILGALVARWLSQ